jgi:hypothetical protein
MTRSTRAFLAATATILTTAATLAGVGVSPASASTVNGVATTVNPSTGSYLASGTSDTEYSLVLPPNAACDGDTASDGYHVWSYLVKKGTNIASLTFSANTGPSQGLGLFDSTATYYGPVNTAITTGQIVGIPNDFEWGPAVSDDSLLSTLLYTGGSSGAWEGGLACANSSGALTDNWNTQFTFTASSSDPNGFVWSAVPGPSGDAVSKFTSASSTTFTAGTAGSFTPKATGAPTPTITESGALPAGVTFSGGVLSGTTSASGTYPITFTATNGIGSPAVQAFTLTVAGGATITSLTPAQLPRGASTHVAINGAGFSGTPKVKVSGTGVTATVVTTLPGTITVNAKVSATATLGARNVTITEPGGATTCTGCFTVVAAPTLTNASPAAVASGGKGTVTFTGTGFETGAKVTFSGPATTLTATKLTVTATTISATVTVPAAAPTGSYTVTVTNPDRSSATCATCFTVTAAPTLTKLSPSSAAKGTAPTVTLTGTGFASGAKVAGPTGVTFSQLKFKSSTTITATMTVSSTAPTGTGLAVTVTNSSSAGYGKATGDLLTIMS